VCDATELGGAEADESVHLGVYGGPVGLGAVPGWSHPHVEMEAVLGGLGFRDSMKEEGRAGAVRVNTHAPTLSGLRRFSFRELLPTCIAGWRIGYSIVENLCPEGGEHLWVSAIDIVLYRAGHVAYLRWLDTKISADLPAQIVIDLVVTWNR
jgi:hypothetical protein